MKRSEKLVVLSTSLSPFFSLSTSLPLLLSLYPSLSLLLYPFFSLSPSLSVDLLFTRWDKVVPGLGATNLLLLLLLFLPVSEFWSFYTQLSILPFFLDNFFDNFLTTFFGNFWQFFGILLATFDNFLTIFWTTF
jgi:hypothetical protein